MPESALIDGASEKPGSRRQTPGAERFVLIDNYDSFTWNLYQYFCHEGATVTVFRNDKITLEKLISLNPTQLVISPGPGEPDIPGDVGISSDAIKYFAGKIPIFGVCMGQQCLYSVFGGQVLATGEWHHGKTSPLQHDGKGIYQGIDQDIPVTRYHSLAGTQASLPPELEVTSRVKSVTKDGQDIIMGVRHKDFVIEGVQFHPESITTAEGLLMCRNFLMMKGGRWDEFSLEARFGSGEKSANGFSSTRAYSNGTGPTFNTNFQQAGMLVDLQANGTAPNHVGRRYSNGAEPRQKVESILDKIFRRRKALVEEQKRKPCSTPEIYKRYLMLGLAPPQISFPERLRKSSYTLSLMAEIKRASPSKGIIAASACAPSQAKEYALAGASVISVLTEPDWFKGDIDDLKAVRQVLQGMHNRPAVLRKEFIFDEYQILEARLAGADTVLLIVKMLDRKRLTELYHYSQNLGMEPLVEVNTPEEMTIAISLGAKVIGVNNRNLETFNVDLGTTTRLIQNIPSDTIVCALSGINGPHDVEAYRKGGVGAVLVGEALMRAPNTKNFVEDLLGVSEARRAMERDVMVKICGTRDAAAAKAAVEAGADMVGMILVEGRKRSISSETALEISQVVHQTRKLTAGSGEKNWQSSEAMEYFDDQVQSLHRKDRALLVGVFQNQPLEHVQTQQQLLNLDIVQFHGSEPIEWASQIPVPVIRRFDPNDTARMQIRGYHALPLLDSSVGGTGEKVNLENLGNDDEDNGLRFMVAGGLSPGNIAETIKSLREKGLVAVDVSSGVEKDGKQDVEKIRAFIRNAKSAAS